MNALWRKPKHTHTQKKEKLKNVYILSIIKVKGVGENQDGGIR